MIVDTGALLAFFDTDEPDHETVSAVLGGATEPLVVSPYVVAELDYLVASRLGVSAELAVLRELTGGAWDLPAIDVEEPIVTLDRRHFDVLRPLGGGRFRILP